MRSVSVEHMDKVFYLYCFLQIRIQIDDHPIDIVEVAVTVQYTVEFFLDIWIRNAGIIGEEDEIEFFQKIIVDFSCVQFFSVFGRQGAAVFLQFLRPAPELILYLLVLVHYPYSDSCDFPRQFL